MRTLVSRLYGLRHRTAPEREIAEELELHRAMLIDEGIGRGLSLDEARREAALALGGTLAIGEAVHEQAGVPLIETVWQDIRYAVRCLRKSTRKLRTRTWRSIGFGKNSLRTCKVREPTRPTVGIAIGREGSWMCPRVSTRWPQWWAHFEFTRISRWEKLGRGGAEMSK